MCYNADIEQMFFSWEAMDMSRRVYVKMAVEIDESGRVVPRRVFWGDGRVFDVEKLIDVRYAAATRAGGQGVCYTCRIMGQRTQLFEDEGRWFVQARGMT